MIRLLRHLWRRRFREDPSVPKVFGMSYLHILANFFLFLIVCEEYLIYF
jgi:hypothetical protein